MSIPAVGDVTSSSMHYLDEGQRARVERLRASWLWRSELPTWLVIAAIYGGWFAVVMNAQALGTPLTIVLLIVLVTWYSSLQHELVHGHPTRWPWVNALFGYAPLAIWYPYGLYRDSHRQHHRNEHITYPGADPESYFVTRTQWDSYRGWYRALLRFRNTIVGRLLVGPIFSVAGAVQGECALIERGNVRVAVRWLVHVTLVVALLVWVKQVAGISPWLYLLGVAYPALALSLVRSFHEHRPVAAVEQRSVLNDAGWLWRLLFLNNNYHLVHHDLPGVPWYGLRQLYLENGARYDQRSGNYCVEGYGKWLRRHAFSPVEHPVHELNRVDR
ncbi:fatty acid desaturase [Steroidobacter cummioxidans]|uniref:fatty acid desaturase n=1 Tax=Steroidobacter cummioxidans TaxID=1803913 RepID=UPI000E310427|nr:fatty acid desaturase [Steroidobacter cummioxidans]